MTTRPKKTRSRKAEAPKPTPAQTAKAGLKRPRAGASKTSTTAQQGQVEIVANELNWLRGAMIVLANLKHDPTGQTKPVTDPDWWGTKRGVYVVRLAKARQAAVGIHRDLNSSFEHSGRIETDVRILIDDLLSKWVPMLEPGRWDIEKSRQVRALYERVEECAKLLRNASSQASGGSAAEGLSVHASAEARWRKPTEPARPEFPEKIAKDWFKLKDKRELFRMAEAGDIALKRIGGPQGRKFIVDQDEVGSRNPQALDDCRGDGRSAQ